jgi:cystathionine beta-synthase
MPQSRTEPAGSALALIGHTPVVEVRGLDTGPCRLFLKLESQNPGGSIKDRIALSMIAAAEADGHLPPGGTIVEATAGNTGLGLALVAARKGYRLVLVIPDKMSHEKVAHLRALGAEVVMTRSDVGKGHPDYYQDKAEALAERFGGYYINQFANPANPQAHETGTAPEMWQQMGGRMDAFICGVGSGGTLTGFSRFLARVGPEVEIVLADPEGSILADLVAGRPPRTPGSWLVEGIGEDFLPDIADLSRVRRAYTISDREAFDTARALLKHDGIFGGSSTGVLVAAALRYCRDQTTEKRVVTLVPDSGNKYLSKMYDDQWMADQGLLERGRRGDLSDLIARRFDEGQAVTVSADDALGVAYRRMKLYDVSQLPVLAEQRIVGLLDESDLLLALEGARHTLDTPVGAVMHSPVETLPASGRREDLMRLFRKDFVAPIVDERGHFLGLVTRIDLINHLRRKVAHP